MRSVLLAFKSRFRTRFPGLASDIYHFLPRIYLRYILVQGLLNGKQIKVLFLGDEYQSRFYSAFIFDNKKFEKVQSGFFLPIIGIPSIAADIVVTRFSHLKVKMEHSITSLLNIRLVVSIREPLEKYLEKLKRSARSDIAKITKQGLYYEISSKESDLHLFYNNMYKPTILARHGDCAIISDYPQVKEFFKEGFLFWIKRGEDCLGAVLARRQDKRLVLKHLGVLDGKFFYTQSGVNAAIFYFCIKHAFENSYNKIDFGISAPFHSDSLLKFKKKWNSKIIRDRDADPLYFYFKNQELKEEFYNTKKPILYEEVDENYLDGSGT